MGSKKTVLLDKFTILGFIKPKLPGKKDFCQTSRFHMSIKAALLLCQLCTNHNYVAGQFNLIPLELGKFLIQETLTSNLKKKQTNTLRIDLARIKNSNPRINYLVLSKTRGKYF